MYFTIGSSSSSSPQESRLDSTALSYAQRQIIFLSSPTISSTQILPLGKLSATLARTVPRHTAQDVNVRQLEQTYGANRSVALVVLTGTYNSLPPDEGVVANGTVVVLVDVARNKAFYLND